MSWTYKGKKIVTVPTDAYGFTYLIQCNSGDYDGYIYIGQKAFYSTTNKRVSKKRSNELYTGRGRKPSRERISRESDWLEYSSSSKRILKPLIEELGRDKFTFKILDFARNKTELTYLELVRMIEFEVFFVNSFNEWMICKIHKKNYPK
jgi:hypothetical protein